MKSILILFLFQMISLNAYGQLSSMWYQMKVERGASREYKSTVISEGLADSLWGKSVEKRNCTVSYGLFSGTFDPSSYKKHYQGILGMRCLTNGEETLTLDVNQNMDFADDEVIILPKIVKDDKVDYISYVRSYGSKIHFPSNFAVPVNVRYDETVEGNRYQNIDSLRFTVYALYDSLSNSLRYLDRFRFSFDKRLRYLGPIGSDTVNVAVGKAFLWDETNQCYFKYSNDVTSKVRPGDSFKLPDGSGYMLDSIDLLNNRMLISKHNTQQKISIKSKSLFEDQIITSDDATSSLRVLHVWGSWCVACLKNMPKLKRLKKSNSEINFTGLCVDNSITVARKSAKKHGITWKNMFFTMKEFELLNLKVTSYPTYFLVDRENNVLGKVNSVESLEKLIEVSQEK